MDRHSLRSPWRHTGLILACLAACDTPRAPATSASAPVTAADPVAAPVTAAADAALALAYIPAEGEAEAAIAAAQDRVRARPDDVAAYDELALRMLRRARETSDESYRRYAEDALRAALRRDASNPETLMVAAMIQQDQHRFRDALATARQYIGVRPDDPTGHLLAGDALLELGEYDPAIDSYQAAMNLRPDLRSYNRAAHMRWLMGDVDGAREVMALALDAGSMRDPESRAWCFVDLGEIDLRRGEAELALRATGAALQLVPEYRPALVLQARALHRLGRVDEAIELQRAALARKSAAEDLLRQAEWLAGAGRHDESSVLREEGLALADAEPRAVAMYLARTRSEPERALQLAEAELSARQNIAAHDTHALALLRLGRIDAARAAIDRAMVWKTADAELHLHAGLVAAAAGDLTRARAARAQALALDAGVDPLLMAELTVAVGES
jgi:tetratricopeptide (TPR) repeat protein